MLDRYEVAEQLSLFPELGSARSTPLAARAQESHTTRLVVAETPAQIGAIEMALRCLLPDLKVWVRYTKNRSLILSLGESKDGSPLFRVHQSFWEAPRRIAEAAVQLYFGRPGPKTRRRLSHLITLWHQEHAPRPVSEDPTTLCAGQHHDLNAILTQVNETHFAKSLAIDITFGQRLSRRLMGHHERREPRSLIVINPLLDHPWITNWYLEFLVFHECLHEVIPARSSKGRFLLHPPEFHFHERAHADHARVGAYEAWVLGPAWKPLKAAAQTMISQRTQSATPPSSVQRTRRAMRGARETGGGEP